jgi:hypothetical protein
MVRMSDLVRGMSPAASPATAPRPVEAPPAALVVEAPPAPAPASPRPPSEPAAAAAPGESRELFDQLASFLERVREVVVPDGQPFPWPALARLVDGVVASLQGSAELFWIAHSPGARNGIDPLALHQARVAVLAVGVGAIVGLPAADLRRLGMAGALIDVGLWQVPDGPRRSDPQSAEYRAHPRASAELVRRWDPPVQGLVDLVMQHHEREQGQGFPQGLAREAIAPHAKILGLVDLYAGLTGAGPRGRARPHEVIRDIVRSKNEAFPPALIKALLSEISVFPPGTPVRLSTGELARVVGVNRHHPLRPRIEVLADGRGHSLPSPRAIDLSEAPFIYITGAATEGR